MYEYLACVSVCLPVCVSGVGGVQKRVLDSPGTGVTPDLSCCVLGFKPGVLWKSSQWAWSLSHAFNPCIFIFGKAVVSFSGMWSDISVRVHRAAVRSGWLADRRCRLRVSVGRSGPYTTCCFEALCYCCLPDFPVPLWSISDLPPPTQHSSLPPPLLPSDPPCLPAFVRYCFSVCFLEINF